MIESARTAAAVDSGSFVSDPPPFERLITQISSSFIELPVDRIDAGIDDGLKSIVTTLGIDRSTLSTVNRRTGQFHSNHSWAAPGFLPVPATVSSRSYPWALDRFRKGLPVVFSRIGDLPPEAAIDAASYASIGLRSHVGMPVMVSGEFTAVLGFAALRDECVWPDALVARMRLLADIFGSVLARKRAHERIGEMLRFERLLVDLSVSLVGSPGDGLDARLREALHAVATFLDVDRISLCGVTAGLPPLTEIHQWVAEGAAGSRQAFGVGDLPWIASEIVAARVIDVPALADLPPAARMDAGKLRAAGVRSLLALPLHNGAAVVGALSLASLRDGRPWTDEIVPRLVLLGNMLLGARTQRSAERRTQRAMAEASQSRERLAHLARVDAVGAMGAAIAHEINQPLMAIENYAHAARRRLARDDSIDRAKLDELLEKVARQAALASDVLNHLRALVKRRDAQESWIDLSVLTGSARQLIEMEGQLKGVRVETVVAPDVQPVLGDEIQIQQVFMNLAHNAMEAMEGVAAQERVLRLEVTAADDGHVLVRVADRGPGITQAQAEKVFEPFHTTRPAGLGIGLSICRTIVEAHGGRLWHAPNPGGGTIFQFTLPTATDEG